MTGSIYFSCKHTHKVPREHYSSFQDILQKGKLKKISIKSGGDNFSLGVI